ncbi:TRAP-type C4-dicarboxylate transport system permease small subunit [Hoeflea halophila]|uniref:TRAP transporter small permease protein n=1 Tax=Hoeflea halophila TaxID=714899 RepID=A0A286IB92_9HYPH|nr:TRAP transporter small permease [Hoeflea halophila]SOE16574.1 TRAP-type C4-dicarboxylate transport system permease small subunit [Hoeflea halophila]
MTAFHLVFRTGLKALLVMLMATLLTVMTAQVIMRYGFNSSLLWSEELCRYLLIWCSFLAMVFAFERGEIAALSILADSLPRVPALALAIVGGVLSAAMCGALAWYGYLYAKLVGSQPIPAISFILGDIFGSSAPAAPTVFWVYFALPLGMMLLGLRIAINIVHYLRAWADGRTLQDLAASHGGPGQ